MKVILKICIVILLAVIGLHSLGEYITDYSEQRFRMRAGVYAIGENRGWSKQKCDSVISIKDDSIMNKYFPIIGLLF